MRADDRIVLSGWSATSESSADLLVGGAVVEGYVAHKSYPENRTDQKVGSSNPCERTNRIWPLNCGDKIRKSVPAPAGSPLSASMHRDF